MFVTPYQIPRPVELSPTFTVTHVGDTEIVRDFCDPIGVLGVVALSPLIKSLDYQLFISPGGFHRDLLQVAEEDAMKKFGITPKSPYDAGFPIVIDDTTTLKTTRSLHNIRGFTMEQHSSVLFSVRHAPHDILTEQQVLDFSRLGACALHVVLNNRPQIFNSLPTNTPQDVRIKQHELERASSQLIV